MIEKLFLGKPGSFFIPIITPFALCSLSSIKPFHHLFMEGKIIKNVLISRCWIES